MPPVHASLQKCRERLIFLDVKLVIVKKIYHIR